MKRELIIVTAMLSSITVTEPAHAAGEAAGEVIEIEGCPPNAYKGAGGKCICNAGYVEDADGLCKPDDGIGEPGGDDCIGGMICDPPDPPDPPGGGGGADKDGDHPSECSDDEVWDADDRTCREPSCMEGFIGCAKDADNAETLCKTMMFGKALDNCLSGKLPGGRPLGGGFGDGLWSPSGITQCASLTYGEACMNFWMDGLDCFTPSVLTTSITVGVSAGGVSVEQSVSSTPKDQTVAGDGWQGWHDYCHSEWVTEVAACDGGFRTCQEEQKEDTIDVVDAPPGTDIIIERLVDGYGEVFPGSFEVQR